MSETLTQTLARNPILAANVAAGDALRYLDVSASGLSKDGAMILSEIRKSFCGFGEQANSSGNTTITLGVIEFYHNEIITFSGLGSTTRIMIMDTSSSPCAGARACLRLMVPTTSGITVEFRDASAGGTLITSFISDTSGDDRVAEFYFDGTAWQFLRFDSYATA